MNRDRPEGFRGDPLVYVTGEERERAVLSLQAYFLRFTGRWFEVLADSDPYRVTASDIVAVSMLGVDVPARTSVWLLGEGRVVISDLLRQIAVDRPIWDEGVDLASTGAAWRLWNELRGGTWPADREGGTEMGPVKTSKLLAAKRPHLLPVYDSVVAEALLGPNPTSAGWWALWRTRLSGPAGQELQRQARSLADDVPEARHLSVLRTLDVAVWMREHGFKTVRSLREAFGEAPSPAQLNRERAERDA